MRGRDRARVQVDLAQALLDEGVHAQQQRHGRRARAAVGADGQRGERGDRAGGQGQQVVRDAEHGQPHGAVIGQFVRPSEVVDRELAPAQLRVPLVLGQARAARKGQHHPVEVGIVTVDQPGGAVHAVRRGRKYPADAHGAEPPHLDLAPQRRFRIDA
ncbi:hypothetical protein OHA25_46955 [Nonomuraea sp. NBC_00507]